jgi:predicted RNA-binding protein with PIN domain
MPFLFDGNNLIGQSAEHARRNPDVRRAFLALLSRCATSRGGKFVVFFDGDAADRSIPPKGVRVRYSAPVSSDEAILRSITDAQVPSELIVVTNDRRLSVRCRDAGARVMDWAEFSSRVENRAPDSKSGPHKEETIDVEEWSKYFGFDPDSLT